MQPVQFADISLQGTGKVIPIDPTTLTGEELVSEVQRVVKGLLGYGAKLPKELMLYVKNMVFLDGAMARLAPDLDLLGEIAKISMMFAERHGERIGRELGIAFVAFSPVGRGVLANGVRDVAALPEKDLRRTMPRFNAENWPINLALIDAMNAIAAREGVTPAQLSLAWVLAQGEHVVAIPGTANQAHLAENIARHDWQLCPALATELDALINRHTVAGPRYGAMIQQAIDTEEFA